jgi:hypothetical protein
MRAVADALGKRAHYWFLGSFVLNFLLALSPLLYIILPATDSNREVAAILSTAQFGVMLGSISALPVFLALIAHALEQHQQLTVPLVSPAAQQRGSTIAFSPTSTAPSDPSSPVATPAVLVELASPSHHPRVASSPTAKRSVDDVIRNLKLLRNIGVSTRHTHSRVNDG